MASATPFWVSFRCFVNMCVCAAFFCGNMREMRISVIHYIPDGAMCHLRNDRAVTSCEREKERVDKRDTCFHICIFIFSGCYVRQTFF